MPAADTPEAHDATVALIRAVAATGYGFVTPTPATIERVRRRRGAAMARDLRDVFGWSLPFAPELLGAPIQRALETAALVSRTPDRWRSAVRLSSLGGQLFAHSAYPTLAADSVFFGPDTYRFVRAIAQWATAAEAGRVRRAVDIGSGAGPGAIVVAQLCPGAEVFGVDVNPAALRLAAANADAAGMAVTWLQSDLLDQAPGSFDLIVANPPYLVDQDERTYRHGGGDLGAGLSAQIVDVALERLAPGGTLLLYTGAAIVAGADPFRAESQSRLDRVNVAWTYEEIDPDVFGEELENGVYRNADRIAAVLLTIRKH